MRASVVAFALKTAQWKYSSYEMAFAIRHIRKTVWGACRAMKYARLRLWNTKVWYHPEECTSA